MAQSQSILQVSFVLVVFLVFLLSLAGSDESIVF